MAIDAAYAHNPYESPETAELEGQEESFYQPRFLSLSGRIGRIRYFAYSTFYYVIMLVLMGIVMAATLPAMDPAAPMDQMDPTLIGAMVAFYVPLLAIFVALARRRLNDLDKSGWYSVFIVLPIVNIFFSVYLFCFPGSEGSNRFGPAPNPNTMSLLIFGVIIPMVGFAWLMYLAIPAYQEYLQQAAAAS